ncbi:hypothetical protein Nepgr_025550 [Nepenthes gracilis]|uniref:Tunicamycin induced 1 n=1 Tax=Nepenthes gracilis TaxID=150966 RepID=A0AAD3T6P8_NEPGR|nr:hypothetical protein Nepgr_025550 [Nepenthes gracilis]
MAFRLRILISALGLSLLIQTLPSTALLSSPDVNPPYPKAISDLREAIVRGLGFQSEDFKISGFDLRDALVGQSVAYEFDIEIDNQVLPFKLLEDVNRWEYVDLPIFRVEDPVRSGMENGLVERWAPENVAPVLTPFQLAGPMEIWVQDAKDMRLSLPHDVDAGVLKKVILAEGAVVTVKGARSVSLRHPIDLPLPLNRSRNGVATGLLALAEHLQHASLAEGTPLLSLRIVGPTSLESPASPSPSSSNRLKLKRLAPGLVELSLPPSQQSTEASSAVERELRQEAPTLLSPSQFTTLWPIPSINGSNPNLLGFERLLFSVLGPRGNKEGSFKLLKADVSAETFLKLGFGVEKQLKEGDGSRPEGFPKWRTMPDTLRMHFEVLAKIEGEKVVPERIMPVNPVWIEDTVADNLISGNQTMSKMPVFHPPSNPFTL